MAKLKDLVVAIGANTTDFDKKLGKSMHKIKAFGKNTKRLGKDLSMSLTAPIAALGFTAVKAFQQQAKAIAQVEAGLKSTGASVGFTSQQLQQMASDLQSKTLFGDEQILQDATAQLLTFTNITGEQFARTQQAALDLATRLDGDLKGASIQLGKALNDPVANLSALSRSGIQFSDEQKEVIKSMAETGRLAEAQTLILDELNKQYGGSAEAAAAADGGFTQLANAFGDLQEQFGKIMVEVLKPVIDYLRDLIERFQDMSPEMKKAIVTFTLVAAAVGPLIFVTGQLVQSMYAIKMAALAMTGPVGLVVAGIGLFAGAVSLYMSSAKDADEEVEKLKKGIEGLNDAEAKRFEENRLRELTKELEEERKTYEALKNQVLTGDAVERRVHQQSVERHRMKIDGLQESIGAIKQEIDNKEWAAMADERLAALAQERAKAESDVADQIERQNAAKDKTKSLGFLFGQLEETSAQVQTDAGMARADARGGKESSLGFLFGQLEAQSMEVSLQQATDAHAEAVDAMRVKQEQFKGSVQQMAGTLQSSFSNLFRGLMDGTQSFGEFMKQILMDLLVQLASMAAAFLVISALIPGGGAALGGFGGFLKSGFGLTGFADGGIVSGPTAALVGEYSGARTNPEVIAPLDKLQSMIQGAGGGNVTVTGRLSGSDILLSSERSNIYRNRVRGY
jgi:hypothetical protein